MKFSSTALAILTAGLVSVGLAQVPLYQTGFESTGDPSGANYTTGNLNGQGASHNFNGWSVVGSATVVSSSGAVQPNSGDQFVSQSPNSTVEARFDDNGPLVFPFLLVKAYHNGEGAPELALPDETPEAASIIAFRSINEGSTYTVAAYDGNQSQFVEPSEEAAFNTDEWTKVLVGVDYGTQVWHMMVNDEPYLADLGFFDDSVTGFRGFRSATNVGANLDTFGVFPSDGDYDGDGFSDYIEMITPGGDPLNPNATPMFGDINADGKVDLLDALYLARIAAGLITAPPGFNFTVQNADMNGDGVVDFQDAVILFDFVTGNPNVPFIPTP